MLMFNPVTASIHDGSYGYADHPKFIGLVWVRRTPRWV